MATLDIMDLVFLTLEKQRQPMHMGMLFMMQIPEDAPDDFVYQLVQRLRQSDAPLVKPFDLLLKGILWSASENFDLDQHLWHIALPKPGRIRELLAYVSKEHAPRLDHSKPLWECHIIEGIEEGIEEGIGRRFAIYYKIHHSVVDGIAAMRLIQNAFVPDINTPSLPIWAAPSRKHLRVRSRAAKPASTSKSLLTPITTLATVAKELWQPLFNQDAAKQHISVFQTPRSILNQKITQARRFSAQSYALDRMQVVASVFGTTLNDIYLAMCAGALRSYLLSHHALPKKPLIAMVPISLRTDDSSQGNQLSMILVDLATHKIDAVTRLQLIVQSINHAKARFARMSKAEIMCYSAAIYGAAGFNLMTGLLPKNQACNIIISNVPGPKETLYYHGAKLEALYPASVLLDGQAMNITATSYQNAFSIGITACPTVLPKTQQLLTLMANELSALEQAAQARITPAEPASLTKQAVPK